MPVSDVFFRVSARAVLTGFMGNPRIMGMLKTYTNLQKNPGSNSVDVPIWNNFTIRSMQAGCATPCSSSKVCDDASATILNIPLVTRYVPTGICLSDLNIMSDEQKAGMVERIIQNLQADFETGVAGLAGPSVFDTLYTDAVFNGVGGGMTPAVLAGTAAGYQEFATCLSRAMAKDNGSGVACIVPPQLDGFIKSIPDRDINRMLDNVTYIVVGNAATFNVVYGGVTYNGRVGFVYPRDALVYVAPRQQAPNMPMMGVAGNMSSAVLDDVSIPGQMLFFMHQYGLRVVRPGDVQLMFAP
jgi:hypothetical protein